MEGNILSVESRYQAEKEEDTGGRLNYIELFSDWPTSQESKSDWKLDSIIFSHS